MPPAKIPLNEAERLAALEQYAILDTEVEQCFDDLTALAASICAVPIALVSLVDHNRQWFKSRVGLDASETPRDFAFCAHAIHGDQILEVNDATQDIRFADNPLVTGEPNIRFYAGAPLITRENLALGTLCIIDQKPRVLNDGERSALEALARQVMSQFELRQVLRDLAETAQTARSAQQAAEAANLAKGRFLANISHEIRTPMNGIIGLTEMALEDLQAPDAIMNLSLVRDSALSLLTIINEVLDFSKIEAGKLRLNLMRLWPHHVLEQGYHLLSTTARAKGIELTLEVDDQVKLPVLGDSTRLQQVFINLLGNAIKFTKQGKVCVNASLKRMGPGKVEWEVSVCDTGPGLSADEQNRIFQPFEQIDDSLARANAGTGLGLAITQELVQLMGGQLKVESCVGEGSTFSFTIPFDECPDQYLMPSKNPVSCQPGPSRQLRVLLAEDNAVNQHLAKSLLERWGHQVVIAANGQEAVDAWKKESFDLILMDLQMPTLDGIAATRVIRQLEGAMGQRIPIIAMSAHVSPGEQGGLEEIGIDSRVTKPFRSDELRHKIAELTNPALPE